MVTPCPICGYDWPADASRFPACPSCALRPLEPSLAISARTWSGLRDGFTAIPRGIAFLGSTRGVKRWLVPPALLTFAAFSAFAWWLWTLVEALLDALHRQARGPVPLDSTWIERALEWLLAKTVLIVLAKLTGFALAFAVAFLAMLWTFSLVYELVSGPFLDEVHGRIEKRWFGIDPRNEREAPRGAGFARWLAWRVGVELRTLAVSAQAALISAMLLVFAVPVLFVPVLGYPMFAIAAGFTTAISLLDIPMSRRRWELGLRLSFLLHHLPAVLAFGIVASVLYMVPVLGPLTMVPAASVGGLWLICRLDKACLRRTHEASR